MVVFTINTQYLNILMVYIMCVTVSITWSGQARFWTVAVWSLTLTLTTQAGYSKPRALPGPYHSPRPHPHTGEAPPTVPEYQGRAREYLGGVFTARALLQTQATGVHREADEVFEGPCSPTARTTGTQIYPAINSFSPLCTVPIKYQYFVKLHLIYAFYLTVYRYMYQRDILSKSVFFSLSLPPTNQMLLLFG